MTYRKVLSSTLATEQAIGLSLLPLHRIY